MLLRVNNHFNNVLNHADTLSLIASSVITTLRKGQIIVLLCSAMILSHTKLSAQNYDKNVSKGNKAYLVEEYQSAIKYYTAALNLVENFESEHSIVLMNLGRSQMILKKYKDADKNFKSCLDVAKKYLNKKQKAQVTKWQTYCKSQLGNTSARKELYQKEVKVKIINLGENINSQYNDYCPSFSQDETVLVFTSTRKGATGFEQTEEGHDYEDLFTSKFEDTLWQPPEKLIGLVNTKYHESVASITPDKKNIYFYRYEENYLGNPKHGGSGDIFYGTKINDEEEVVERLSSKINTKYWESHPFITNDGNTLYFVSDRPGGTGGRDIYVSHKTTLGKWQPAKNIGKPVNTEHDEASPYFNSDANILYFSSKGHPGMGGYDIFKTTLKEENWVDPVNLGYPINHESDDIFFRLTPTGWSAYFSTVREGGYGGLDLYKVAFPEPMIKFITLMGQGSDVGIGKFKFVNLSADMINKIGLIDESKITAERKYMVKGVTIGEFDKNNKFTFKNLTPDEITKLSHAKSSNITAEGKYVVEGTVIGSWNEKGVFSFANLDPDGIARLGLTASDFQSGPTQGMPVQFKKVDSNGDLCISADEIYAAIDAYFEGDRSFTVDMLFRLIDYFFIQDC